MAWLAEEKQEQTYKQKLNLIHCKPFWVAHKTAEYRNILKGRIREVLQSWHGFVDLFQLYYYLSKVGLRLSQFGELIISS